MKCAFHHDISITFSERACAHVMSAAGRPLNGVITLKYCVGVLGEGGGCRPPRLALVITRNMCQVLNCDISLYEI